MWTFGAKIMAEFDVQGELARLQKRTKLVRKKRFRHSQLDQYHGELMSLKKAGASATQLQQWLREKSIRVHLTTVTRWLDNRRG